MVRRKGVGLSLFVSLQICIWEPKQQAVINTIYAHQDTVKGLAFNPNTENVAVPVLASAGGDKLCLSDPRPSHRADILSVSMHKQGKEVEAVAVSPDGSLLVSGGRDGLLVLMTLMVPSIVPRSDSNHMHLTSSILRKSRVVRDRSYICDVTADDDILLEFEEEEDMMKSWTAEEDEMVDHFPLEPKKTEKKTFSRMKRRSRFEEKETELPDYATVRKKTGVSAKTARGKRTKGKSYDIPQMVAHLSAAVRVYGPEEPSSSDSEGETSPRAPRLEQTAPRDDPKVDILTHIKAWSNPDSISISVPKPKPKDLPEGIGKAKTHKHFFESGGPVSKHHEEETDEESPEKGEQSEGFLQKYGHLLPAELENTLQTSYSPSTISQPLQPAQYDVGNSFRLEDLMAVNSEDSLLQWTNSPVTTMENSDDRKAGGEHQPQFIPTLQTQQEQEEDGEYSEDDVPMSMI